MARPKPRLLPVTSQVLVMAMSSRGTQEAGTGAAMEAELGVEVGSLDPGAGGVGHQEGEHGGDHREAGQRPEGGKVNPDSAGSPSAPDDAVDDAADHRGARALAADGPDVDVHTAGGAGLVRRHALHDQGLVSAE